MWGLRFANSGQSFFEYFIKSHKLLTVNVWIDHLISCAQLKIRNIFVVSLQHDLFSDAIQFSLCWSPYSLIFSKKCQGVHWAWNEFRLYSMNIFQFVRDSNINTTKCDTFNISFRFEKFICIITSVALLNLIINLND